MGASSALDCVGGEATQAVTAALQPGASTIIYGALGGPVLQMNILDVFLGKSLKVRFCNAAVHVACVCWVSAGHFQQAFRSQIMHIGVARRISPN